MSDAVKELREFRLAEEQELENKKNVSIVDCLKTEDCWIKLYDRWLYWEVENNQWVVRRNAKAGKRGTVVLIETKDEFQAVRVLRDLEEDET